MRNPIYEQALAKQGLEWHYEEKILLEDIDTAQGLRNQARLELPLDTDLVASYAEAKKDSGLSAAPSNVRIQDFASIAKDLEQAAFGAGQGATVDPMAGRSSE